MVESLSLVFTGIALSQVALVLVKLVRVKRRSIAETVYVYLLISVFVYLLSEVIHVESLWLAILFDGISTGVPGLFWLLCGCLFVENYRPKRWQFCVILLTVGLPQVFKIATQGVSDGTVNHWLEMLFVTLPQAIEFALLGHALWLVVVSYRDDLVSQRRQLRVVVFGFSGLLIFSTIFGRQIMQLQTEWFDVVVLMVASVYLFAFNLVTFDWQNDIFSVNRSNSIETQDPEIIKLNALMDGRHYYRNHGLTINQLARELGVPLHRLRKLINGELGFRNFNVFLNGFRIREAASRLENEETPILNIALDVGFKSLSSFNQVFKVEFHLTPSEFRKTSR